MQDGPLPNTNLKNGGKNLPADRRKRPLLSAALIAQRNVLAEQHLPFLNWFAGVMCRKHHRVFGGTAGVRSELTCAYLEAIERWLTRDTAASTVSLSTFIGQMLRWERHSLNLRALLIHVPGQTTTELPTERLAWRISEIRDIQYLRGKDAKCDDGRLLVYPALQRAYILSELKAVIHRVFRTLLYREREILKLRHGLEDGYIYSLEEVARIFKITREHVRQIEAKAMRKLRHPVRSQQLELFWRDLTKP